MPSGVGLAPELLFCVMAIGAEITWVVGLMERIAALAVSVNQRLPSGPAVILWGLGVEPPAGVEIGKSAERVGGFVARLMNPIAGFWKVVPPAIACASVNQMLPSGPTVIPIGSCPAPRATSE